MESKDYTYFTAQVLSSFSSNQDNSMLAPGFSMSLRLNRNSIIIILSGKYKYDFKKTNFKSLKSSYKISSGIDREEKPCSTDEFGEEDNCKLAQGSTDCTVHISMLVRFCLRLETFF